MAMMGYVVSSVKNKLSGDKAVYGARIRHMAVLRGDYLYEEFAKYMATNPSLVESFITGLGGFMKRELQRGCKLDFGAFKVGLSLRGGFDSENGRFDPKRNKVCVTLSPGVQLTKAVAKIIPDNITRTANPKIRTVYPLDGSRRTSAIVCRVPCGMNGMFPNTDFKGDGDGIWLETEDGGKRIASAKIISTTASRIDFQIDDDVPPGRYRVFVGAHSRNDVGIASDWVGVAVVKKAAK